MNENCKFNECVAKVNKLRATLHEMDENRDVSLQEAVTKLAKNQLLSLLTINDFFGKVSTNQVLKQLLDNENDTILMPDQHSVRNFQELVRVAFAIFNEMARSKKSESAPDRQFFDEQKTNLNRLSCCDLNNKDFNRYYSNLMKYYALRSAESEEFGDSTVNAIFSGDILTSSPIEKNKD